MSWFSGRLSWLFGVNDYDNNKSYENEETNSELKELNEVNSFYGATSLSFRKGIVGTGFNIYARSDDEAFNKEYNKIIEDFSKRGYHNGEYRSNCELTDSYTFSEAQRALADEYAVKSGGYLIKHHYNKKFKYGYKFELVPLYLIDTTKNSIDENIVNGLKFNKQRQIITIYIYDKLGQSKPISYKNLTLVINKWADINQRSGVTPLKRVKEALEYIDNYKAKEMEGAGKRAETPIIIKTPYFSQILQSIKNKFREKNQLTPDVEEDLYKQAFDNRNLKRQKDTTRFAYVDKDEEVVELGKGVSTIYPDLWKNELSQASIAVGLSPYSTSGIMPSSYNQALRAAQDEELTFKIYADEIKPSIEEIIGYRLIIGCKLVGKLPDVDFFRDPDKYLKFELIRDEKGHIDPLKTSKANSEDINVNGTKTVPRALREKGIDPDEHLREKKEYLMKVLEMEKEVKEEYEKAGIVYEKATESLIKDEELEDE